MVGRRAHLLVNLSLSVFTLDQARKLMAGKDEKTKQTKPKKQSTIK